MNSPNQDVSLRNEGNRGSLVSPFKSPSSESNVADLDQALSQLNAGIERKNPSVVAWLPIMRAMAAAEAAIGPERFADIPPLTNSESNSGCANLMFHRLTQEMAGLSEATRNTELLHFATSSRAFALAFRFLTNDIPEALVEVHRPSKFFKQISQDYLWGKMKDAAPGSLKRLFAHFSSTAAPALSTSNVLWSNDCKMLYERSLMTSLISTNQKYEVTVSDEPLTRLILGASIRAKANIDLATLGRRIAVTLESAVVENYRRKPDEPISLNGVQQLPERQAFLNLISRATHDGLAYRDFCQATGQEGEDYGMLVTGFFLRPSALVAHKDITGAILEGERSEMLRHFLTVPNKEGMTELRSQLLRLSVTFPMILPPLLFPKEVREAVAELEHSNEVLQAFYPLMPEERIQRILDRAVLSTLDHGNVQTVLTAETDKVKSLLASGSIPSEWKTPLSDLLKEHARAIGSEELRIAEHRVIGKLGGGILESDNRANGRAIWKILKGYPDLPQFIDGTSGFTTHLKMEEEPRANHTGELTVVIRQNGRSSRASLTRIARLVQEGRLAVINADAATEIRNLLLPPFVRSPQLGSEAA